MTTVARCVSNSLVLAVHACARRPRLGIHFTTKSRGIRIYPRTLGRPTFRAFSISKGIPSSPPPPPDGLNGDADGRRVSEGRHRVAGLGSGHISFTAVLLGWLGAEHRYLRRYADIYRSRGMRVVTMVIGPGELLRVDLGRMVEQRIVGFTRDLISLVEEEEELGLQSCLLFHTFSNTGWLAYGAILDNLRSRADIVDKIKGCVIDSGADPNINPKVWAAGFCSALLKKSSNSLPSSFDGSMEKGKAEDYANNMHTNNGNPNVVETLFLKALEIFFTFLLKYPDVNKRLERIISVLSKCQPLCPQLYLYSSADKVIPYKSIENFAEEQKTLGRNVCSYNFQSSPHVDHLRAFPDVYLAQVHKLLEKSITVASTRCTS